jgi:MFS family permease
MLPVILIAMFMAGFDIWAVNVAAPSLQRDLHVSDAALQLIVGGYAFMSAARPGQAARPAGGRPGSLSQAMNSAIAANWQVAAAQTKT